MCDISFDDVAEFRLDAVILASSAVSSARLSLSALSLCFWMNACKYVYIIKILGQKVQCLLIVIIHNMPTLLYFHTVK
jgi:hypothetical protein